MLLNRCYVGMTPVILKWWSSYFLKFDTIRNFESNGTVTSVFDSKRAQLFEIFWNTYHHRSLTYLTEWCRFFTLATTPSNQQNLLLTMDQVLYLLEVFILAHYYGLPSTETPTTETTIVRCHKNSRIYLTSTYYWWLLRQQ